MSKTIASLLVGLLAIADGSSTDRELLSEANRDDVLNVISPELLDSIAKRLYTQDSSEMSAYERLVKEDKQRKMDYLNNVNREANSNGIPAPTANDFIPHHDHVQEYDSHRANAAQEKIERVLRDSERIDGKLYSAKESLKDERDLLLGDKAYYEQQRESQQKRREKKEKSKAKPANTGKQYYEDQMAPNRFYDDDQYYHRRSNEPFPDDRDFQHKSHHARHEPRSNEEERRQRKLEKKRLQREQQAKKDEEDRLRAEADDLRKRQEELQKQLADQKDEERKAEEERQKKQEEKRKRREEKRKQKAELEIYENELARKSQNGFAYELPRREYSEPRPAPTSYENALPKRTSHRNYYTDDSDYDFDSTFRIDPVFKKQEKSTGKPASKPASKPIPEPKKKSPAYMAPELKYDQPVVSKSQAPPTYSYESVPLQVDEYDRYRPYYYDSYSSISSSSVSSSSSSSYSSYSSSLSSSLSTPRYSSFSSYRTPSLRSSQATYGSPYYSSDSFSHDGHIYDRDGYQKYYESSYDSQPHYEEYDYQLSHPRQPRTPVPRAHLKEDELQAQEAAKLQKIAAEDRKALLKREEQETIKKSKLDEAKLARGEPVTYDHVYSSESDPVYLLDGNYGLSSASASSGEEQQFESREFGSDSSDWETTENEESVSGSNQSVTSSQDGESSPSQVSSDEESGASSGSEDEVDGMVAPTQFDRVDGTEQTDPSQDKIRQLIEEHQLAQEKLHEQQYDLQIKAEAAEEIAYQAMKETEDAEIRAKIAESAVTDAEKKMRELEAKALEAERRSKELEKLAHEAETKLKQLESEKVLAEQKAHDFEEKQKAAERKQAEIEQQQIQAEKLANQQAWVAYIDQHQAAQSERDVKEAQRKIADLDKMMKKEQEINARDAYMRAVSDEMAAADSHPGMFEPARLHKHEYVEESENYTPRLDLGTEKKADKGLQTSQPGAPKKQPQPVIDFKPAQQPQVTPIKQTSQQQAEKKPITPLPPQTSVPTMPLTPKVQQPSLSEQPSAPAKIAPTYVTPATAQPTPAPITLTPAPVKVTPSPAQPTLTPKQKEVEQPVVIPTYEFNPQTRPSKPITPQVVSPMQQPQPGLTPAKMAPGFMDQQKYQYGPPPTAGQRQPKQLQPSEYGDSPVQTQEEWLRERHATPMPVPEKGPIDQRQTYYYKEPSTADMHYFYPSHREETDSENELEDEEWALKKTLRDIDEKIQLNKDQKTRQGQQMAEAAEAARAKYKKQQNGLIEPTEAQIENVYSHYTHHKSPTANIVYDVNYSNGSSSEESSSNSSNDVNELRGVGPDAGFNAEQELNAELGNADEEDLKLDTQEKEDEQKLKAEYEQKLDELKAEYITKMKEVADKFDEKHRDLQTKRIDVERQYEKALAEYTEEHEATQARRVRESDSWKTDPRYYYDDDRESHVREPGHHQGDIFDTFSRYHDILPYQGEYEDTYYLPGAESGYSSASSYDSGYSSSPYNGQSRQLSNEDPFHIQNAEPVDFEPRSHQFTSPKDFEIDWKSPYKVTMPYSTVLNLARRQLNEAFVDPLADIKKRERDLLRERDIKEAELRRDYEKRLQEFEEDMQMKERELEKEKLYQERKLIERREDELEAEREEQERRRTIGGPVADDDEDDYYGLEDDEYDGVSASQSFSSYYSSTESNGQIDTDGYSSEGEQYFDQQYRHFNPYAMPSQFPQSRHQQRGNDTSDDSVQLSDTAFEIEWQLDVVPKKIPAKKDPTRQKTILPWNDEPEPTKPRSKKQRADRDAKPHSSSKRGSRHEANPYDQYEPDHHTSYKPSSHKKQHRNDLVPRVPTQANLDRKGAKESAAAAKVDPHKYSAIEHLGGADEHIYSRKSEQAYLDLQAKLALQEQLEKAYYYRYQEESREVVNPKKVDAHKYKYSSPHHYDGYRLNELLSSDDYAANGQVEDKLKTKKSKKSKKSKPEESQAEKQSAGFTHAYIQEDLSQHQQWHPDVHEPVLPLHPTAAIEHDYKVDAPQHDIKDYYPVPEGFRKVTPPHMHHYVQERESEASDDTDSEASQGDKPTVKKTTEDSDIEPEFKEIHRHSQHVEELSLALLKDRQLQQQKKKEVIEIDPYPTQLHKIDPYSLAELADQSRPKVQPLPVDSKPEIVDIKPVRKKSPDTEEYQLTIDVPIHQTPVTHHQDVHEYEHASIPSHHYIHPDEPVHEAPRYRLPVEHADPASHYSEPLVDYHEAKAVPVYYVEHAASARQIPVSFSVTPHQPAGVSYPQYLQDPQNPGLYMYGPQPLTVTPQRMTDPAHQQYFQEHHAPLAHHHAEAGEYHYIPKGTETIYTRTQETEIVEDQNTRLAQQYATRDVHHVIDREYPHSHYTMELHEKDHHHHKHAQESHSSSSSSSDSQSSSSESEPALVDELKQKLSMETQRKLELERMHQADLQEEGRLEDQHLHDMEYQRSLERGQEVVTEEVYHEHPLYETQEDHQRVLGQPVAPLHYVTYEVAQPGSRQQYGFSTYSMQTAHPVYAVHQPLVQGYNIPMAQHPYQMQQQPPVVQAPVPQPSMGAESGYKMTQQDQHRFAHLQDEEQYFASASSSSSGYDSSSSDGSSSSERDPEVLTHLFQQSDSLQPKDFPEIDPKKYASAKMQAKKSPSSHPEHPQKTSYVQEGDVHQAFLQGGSPETPAMAKAEKESQKSFTKKDKSEKAQDPSMIDFQKIERQREATHQAFKQKYIDEDYPHDPVHGGRYDYDGKLSKESAQPSQADIEDRKITMDMLRRYLEDIERDTRKVIGDDQPFDRDMRKIIGTDEPFLEGPVPPLQKPTPLTQLKAPKPAEKDDSKDRFDLMDEDFLKQSFDKQPIVTAKPSKKTTSFPSPEELKMIEKIQELTRQEIESTKTVLVDEELTKEALDKELLSPVQLTPKQSQTSPPTAQFHPSFQPILTPETISKSAPAPHQQHHEQTYPQQPVYAAMPMAYGYSPAQPQQFYGEFGQQTMYYPQMIVPGTQWMTTPQQFSQQYGPVQPLYYYVQQPQLSQQSAKPTSIVEETKKPSASSPPSPSKKATTPEVVPIGMDDPDAPVIMTKIVPFDKKQKSSDKSSAKLAKLEKSPAKGASKDETEANMLLPYDHGKHNRGFYYEDQQSKNGKVSDTKDTKHTVHEYQPQHQAASWAHPDFQAAQQHPKAPAHHYDRDLALHFTKVDDQHYVDPHRRGPIAYTQSDPELPSYLDKELYRDEEEPIVIPQPQYVPHPMHVLQPHESMHQHPHYTYQMTTDQYLHPVAQHHTEHQAAPQVLRHEVAPSAEPYGSSAAWTGEIGQFYEHGQYGKQKTWQDSQSPVTVVTDPHDLVYTEPSQHSYPTVPLYSQSPQRQPQYVEEKEPESSSKHAKKDKKKKSKKSKKANQYYMSYDELYPELQYPQMPTYQVPVPEVNYKYHYGMKGKKGTHTFNDVEQVQDYIPPHYLKYDSHYGKHEHKGQHSFTSGDLSDFGNFRANGFDAHSYLWGPGEYHDRAKALLGYDVHEFLDENQEDHQNNSKKIKAQKHKTLDISIQGDMPQDDIELNMDSKVHSVDLAVGHAGEEESRGHRMQDSLGNSYMNTVTPLYYYPSNGYNYNPFGYQNLESSDAGISSGMMNAAADTEMYHYAHVEHPSYADPTSGSENGPADTEMYHYGGVEHPGQFSPERSEALKKREEQNQPLLHHLLQ